MNLKIPFAIRQFDRQIVGVEDVPRGKAAKCVCPSCKRPLIARQGDVNTWHFAHDFSGTKADLCSYSVFESVREAIMWLLPQLDKIRVPGVGERPAKQVAYSEVLRADDVDARINVGDFRLLLWSDYPGRHWDGDESTLGDKTGLLAFLIDDLVGQRSKGILSIGRLRRWLEEEELAKRWIHHPVLSHHSLRNKVNQECDDREFEHHCVMCNSIWTGGPGIGSATCNKCASHLYVTSTPRSDSGKS